MSAPNVVAAAKAVIAAHGQIPISADGPSPLDAAVHELREAFVDANELMAGTYCCASLGYDLAKDPVGRNMAIAHTMKTFRDGTDGAPPDLIVISVTGDLGETVADMLRPFLDGEAGEATQVVP
jgi:hypothetical protein